MKNQELIRVIIVKLTKKVHIYTSQIKTINWHIYRIAPCIGHELCQPKVVFTNFIMIIIIIIIFHVCEEVT